MNVKGERNTQFQNVFEYLRHVSNERKRLKVQTKPIPVLEEATQPPSQVPTGPPPAYMADIVTLSARQRQYIQALATLKAQSDRQLLADVTKQIHDSQPSLAICSDSTSALRVLKCLEQIIDAEEGIGTVDEGSEDDKLRVLIGSDPEKLISFVRWLIAAITTLDSIYGWDRNIQASVGRIRQWLMTREPDMMITCVLAILDAFIHNPVTMETEFHRLQEAFNILFSDEPNVLNDMRRVAQQHIDTVAAGDHDGVFCLDLFLGLSKRVVMTSDAERLAPRTHEIRFWCLQVLGRVIPTLSSQQRRNLSDRLWTEYFEAILCQLFRRSLSHQGSGEETFVLNKYLSNEAAIIALEYPNPMSNAFSRYLDKIGSLFQVAQSKGSPLGQFAATEEGASMVAYTQAYLQLHLLLDSELIADEISSRTEEERAVSMRIKDGLRMGDINMAFHLMQKLFSGSLFEIDNLIAQRVKGSITLEDLPSYWLENTTLALKVLSRISAWADTGLIVGENSHFVEFYQLAMANTFGPNVTDAAYDAFHGLVYKKMDGAQKTLLLKRYGLIPMFVDSVRRTVGLTNFRVKQATVLNTVCDQILESLLDVLHFLKKDFNSSENPNPYRLHLSRSEFEDVFRELWSLLFMCSSLAVQFFAPSCGEVDEQGLVTDVQAAERITPALHNFFRVVRIALKDSSQYGGLPQLEDFKAILVSTFVAVLGRVRIPDVLRWEEFYEEEDDFFNPEEDDGSDVSAFFVCRHASLLLCRKVFSVSLLCGSLASDVLKYLKDEVQRADLRKPKDFRTVESAICIHISCLEAYKDSIASPEVRPLVSSSVSLALSWKSLMEDPECPPLPRIAYFDLIGRLSLLFKQGIKNVDFSRDTFVSEGLMLLLGPKGLQSTDSRKVISTAIRELLRFTRSVQHVPPDAALSAISLMQQLGYLEVDVLPSSTIAMLQPEADEDWDEVVSGSWLSTTFVPSRPLLSLEDQTRLYEFVGHLVPSVADKKRVFGQLLDNLLRGTDRQSLSGMLTDQTSRRLGSEWLIRTLRCCGNLLKVIAHLPEAEGPVNRLLDTLMFAIECMGGPGKIQQNVLFVARRLVACCPVSTLAAPIKQLCRVLYANVHRYVQASVMTGGRDKRVPAAIDGVAAFMNSIITSWTDEGFVDVLMSDQDGISLFDWCLAQHVMYYQQLVQASGDAQLAMQAQVDILSMLQTAAAKCPIGLAILMFYQHLKAQSPAATPSTVGSTTPAILAAVRENSSEDHIGLLVNSILRAKELNEITHTTAGCVQAYVQVFLAVHADPNFLDKCRVVLQRLSFSNAHMAATLSGERSFLTKDRETMFAGILQSNCFKLNWVVSACVKTSMLLRTSQDPAAVRFCVEFMTMLRMIFTNILPGTKMPSSDPLLQQVLEQYRQPTVGALSSASMNCGSVEQLVESTIQSHTSKDMKDSYIVFINGPRGAIR